MGAWNLEDAGEKSSRRLDEEKGGVHRIIGAEHTRLQAHQM
jgi:hypothetical protein